MRSYRFTFTEQLGVTSRYVSAAQRFTIISIDIELTAGSGNRTKLRHKRVKLSRLPQMSGKLVGNPPVLLKFRRPNWIFKPEPNNDHLFFNSLKNSFVIETTFPRPPPTERIFH